MRPLSGSRRARMCGVSTLFSLDAAIAHGSRPFGPPSLALTEFDDLTAPYLSPLAALALPSLSLSLSLRRPI